MLKGEGGGEQTNRTSNTLSKEIILATFYYISKI